jgi:hypothetical protein
MKDNEYFGLTCEALCEGLAALLHGCEEDGIDFYVAWAYGEWGKGQHTIRKHINVILSDAIAMLKNQHEEIERLKKEQEAITPKISEMLKDYGHGETFIVIDSETGKEADMYNIALYEDWAKHLCYCDMDGWAIEDDGTLLLVDECGRCAYADRERFKVKWE